MFLINKISWSICADLQKTLKRNATHEFRDFLNNFSMKICIYFVDKNFETLKVYFKILSRITKYSLSASLLTI